MNIAKRRSWCDASPERAFRIKRGRPSEAALVPLAHPQEPPTGPSHPMANCVHARANQIEPFELFELLQVCH